MLMPPMLTKQNFVRVTSISRTGSQNEIGRPYLTKRGGGAGHWQIIFLGLDVSSPPGDTFIPQIVIGNKQLQQISLTGFTNLPAHFANADENVRIARA
ncbi:hypothetical protein FACS1894122_07990 [Alphaproteobacteria bacterium]|nr:hypothetical protein FACS1894122_07990 [Alphaproteobacteria bacterium]